MPRITGFRWAAFALLLLPLRAHSDPVSPTEESLIQAWEKFQSEDPKTLVFRKIADGRYRFKTSRFAYDGELRVKGADIEDLGMEAPIMGRVDVELVGLPRERWSDLGYGFASWLSSGNALYYDQKTQRWQTFKQYRAQAASRRVSWMSFPWIGTILILALAILLIVQTQFRLRSARKLQLEAMARNARVVAIAEERLKVGQDANRILLEIRDLLKKQG